MKEVKKENDANIEFQVKKLVDLSMSLWRIYTAVLGLITLFSRGKKSQQARKSLAQGLALQFGVFVAKKAWDYYQVRQSERTHARQLLLKDQHSEYPAQPWPGRQFSS